MLKPLLVGAAMALALPAFAQTGSSNPGTSTNDDRGNAGMSGGAMGQQTNPAIPAQAATSNCSQGMAASTAQSGNRRGARGTAASTCGRMQGSATAQGSASAQGDSGWGTSGTGTATGTMVGTGSMSGSGAMSGTGTGTGTMAGTGGSGSYTGRGGPLETGKSYPACSRTLTDNCTQRVGRSRHHRH